MAIPSKDLFGGALFAAGLVAATPASAQQFTNSNIDSGFISSSNRRYSALQVVDLNGDGHKDLLAVGRHDVTGVRWYENDGMDPPGYTERMFAYQFFNNGIAVDFDGDGDMDVLTHQFDSSGEPNIFAYENDGMNPPSFTSHYFSSPSGFANGDELSELVVGDVDLDGNLDVVATSMDTGTLYLIKGNGTFQAMVAAQQEIDNTLTFGSPILDSEARGVKEGSARIADINGDGFPDIVCGALNAAYLYLGDGVPGSPSFVRQTLGNVTGNNQVRVADMDGDGDLDIVFATATGNGLAGTLGFFENDGAMAPTFTQVDIVTDGPYQDVEVMDFNFDTAADLIAIRFVNNSPAISTTQVRWFENDGGVNPAFVESQVDSSTGHLAFDMAIGDLDSDGDTDAASVFYVGATWRITLHDNNFDPTAPAILAQPLSLFVSPPGSAMFSVTAVLDDTHQWRRNGVPLVDGAGISGATTNTLSIADVEPGDAGEYDCLMTNPQGSTVTATAVLGVAAPGCPADINGDGIVDTADLGIVLGVFGANCP